MPLSGPQPMVQVAGVIDQAEADLLIECGVRWLGFPLRLPVHREDLSEAAAAKIIAGLPRGVHPVLITYLDKPDAILALCSELGVNVVQLHGDIEVAALEQLKEQSPELSIIKSLVIGRHDEQALANLVSQADPVVDAYITDTFDPRTGASGATGQTHDWQVSKRLVEHSKRPLILAGGLTPENVAAAIRAVRPAGVDAHTGLEDAAGRKSRSLVQQFLQQADEAFAS